MFGVHLQNPRYCFHLEIIGLTTPEKAVLPKVAVKQCRDWNVLSFTDDTQPSMLTAHHAGTLAATLTPPLDPCRVFVLFFEGK